MKSKSFLFILTMFLISFAIAQSQMITGTLVPDKKKSVVLLPGNKKDSLTAASKKVQPAPKLKDPVIADPVLRGSDNTVIGADKNTPSIDPELLNIQQQKKLKDPINGNPVLNGSNTKVIVQDKNTPTIDPQLINIPQQNIPNQNVPQETNSKGLFITGTITPENGETVLIKPGMQDSLKKTAAKQSVNGKKINNPLDVLDTTLIAATGSADVISKYSLPPQKSALRPQIITGKLEAKEGAAVTIVPVSEDSLYKQNMGAALTVADNPLFPPERKGEKDSLGISTSDTSSKTTASASMKTALDGLDTTNMVFDPSTHISVSTSPLRPSEYKHQMLPSGALVAKKGEPVTFEPISKDSLEALNRKLTDTTMQSSDAFSSNDSYNNTSFPDSSAVSNFKTNFFVNQNGKFSVRFTTEKFYLNISQAGKVIDFEILSNGKITSNESSKIVQVGNIKVKYNDDGSIASIADTRVAYTFDGRVNRVGNINISYTKEGYAEKVADIPIIYNSNRSVEKIADFRVGYDAKQMVIGIDDSNGLVVFKPVVK